MEHRIALKKIMFLHHLLNLPENSLAYQLACVQDSLGYPGLIAECKSLLNVYNIKENPKLCSKVQWKKLWKKRILEQNRKDILEIVKKYKKLNYGMLSKEKFETKSYLREMSTVDARLKFSLRSRMTRTVQTNFKGDPKFSKNRWLCVECGNIDTQEHIMECHKYSDLRLGMNLKNDDDLVKYFRKVISLRESR